VRASSPIGDRDVLQQNIAQMYQYYNQLIFRQGQNNKYMPNPTTIGVNQGSSFGNHRTVTYNMNRHGLAG